MIIVVHTYLAITITGEGADIDAKWTYGRNKGEIFKICALFTDAISETNNTQVDNAKDLDVVMLMYNLVGYSDNCWKTSGSSWLILQRWAS